MSALMFGLLAETHIHPGTGQEDDTVDLPVARERTTGYPVIAGSSVKGGLKEFASLCDTGKRDEKTDMPPTVQALFGVQDAAGQLMVGDARLLLLPVRSLTGAYRWLTCPHLIERLARDCRRAGLPDVPSFDATALSGITKDGAPPILTAGTDSRLFLEERSFTVAGPVDPALTALIATFIGDAAAAARLPAQIAIVADNDFAWFARNALSIQARNALDRHLKTSSNLWYEELLPPDTVFHLLLAPRTNSDIKNVKWLGDELDGKWLQLGANETVGQGWFRATHVGANRREG